MSFEKNPKKIAEREVKNLMEGYKNFTLMQKSASENRLNKIAQQNPHQPISPKHH